MDHLVPLVRGGVSAKSNVVPCCKECNNQKRYLLPWEWAKYQEQARQAGGGEERAADAAASYRP